MASSSSSSSSSTTTKKSDDTLGLIDIGINLVDPMYSGVYRGKYRHESDLSQILIRASQNNVQKLIITAGTFEESQQAFDLVQTLREAPPQPNNNNNMEKENDNDPPPPPPPNYHIMQLATSVGVHPTRCQQEFGFDSTFTFEVEEKNCSQKIQQMRTLITKGLASKTVVTLGELGLDYARTEFCSIEYQKRGLLAQLKLALEFPQLPLFIHNRDTGSDLYDILKEYYCRKINRQNKQQSKDNNNTTTDNSTTTTTDTHHHHHHPLGVIHSFDDTIELALQFIDLGMYIGINGCSLKTPESLKVVQSIPLSKIVLETDGPWCNIRPSHASYEYVQTTFPTKQEKKFEKGHCVKNRTEPCHIIQVAEVVAGVKGLSVEEVKEICWKNTHSLFQLLE